MEGKLLCLLQTAALFLQLGGAVEWNPECKKGVWKLVDKDCVLEVHGQEAEMAYITSSHEPAVQVAAFPAGCNVHWETQNRPVWNQQECADEEEELVYEVAWIPELDVWRRFLRSRRTLHS